MHHVAASFNFARDIANQRFSNRKGARVLELRSIQKRYNARTVIESVSLSVRSRESVCVLGPSGCGKTTLLRISAGLSKPCSGEVIIHSMDDLERSGSWAALVFQNYERSLLPWLRAVDNVAFGMAELRLTRRQRLEKALDCLASVGLADFAESLPWQLSGGMQQRVAIARALASTRPLMMLDEPFASVDAMTRARLQQMYLSLARTRRLSTLMVTHDIEEAVYIGDRIIVLSGAPAKITLEIVNPLSAEDRANIVPEVLNGHPKLREVTRSILAAIAHSA